MICSNSIMQLTTMHEPEYFLSKWWAMVWYLWSLCDKKDSNCFSFKLIL